jgi:hypothetical protein
MQHQPTSITYFVICVDYGRKGREAIADPEMTFHDPREPYRSFLRLPDGRLGRFAIATWVL